ncbi:DUF6090 family protein [Ekhidna sp. MALMAid0563]
MAKNTITSYLLYAIGEIILVVIGILIAVNIDHWNQQVKNEEDILATFQNVAFDLKSDIDFLKMAVEDFTWKNEYMISIQNGDFTREEWIANDSIFNSFIGYYDFKVDEENISLLKSKNPESVMSKALTKEIINFYKKFSIEIAVRHRETDDVTYNNLNYWRDNMKWYSLALIEGDYSALADHAIGNPLFRNRLVHKRIMQGRLAAKLKEYIKEADQLILKIEEANQSQ